METYGQRLAMAATGTAMSVGPEKDIQPGGMNFRNQATGAYEVKQPGVARDLDRR
jgi:hypothetical protein